MLQILRRLRANIFLANVTKIAGGAAGAQALTLLATPIITRVYGPAEFGVFGVFLSIMSMLTPVATLNLGGAIVLSKSEREARVVSSLCLYAGLLLALLSLPATPLLLMTEASTDAGANYGALVLLPIALLSACLLAIAQQWTFRAKLFGTAAKASMFNGFLANGGRVALGFVWPTAVTLIAVTLLTNVIYAFDLRRRRRASMFDTVALLKPWRFRRILAKYSHFVLYGAPQNLLNGIGQGLPVFIFAATFGPIVTGFYTLGRVVLALPSALVARAVGDVLYPRLAELHHQGHSTRAAVTKATLLLLGIGIVPFGVVALFGPQLFALVFGDDWVRAGEFARWMAVWTYAAFLNRPAVVAVPVLKLQREYLIFEILSTALRAGVIFGALWLFGTDIAAVITFSVTSMLLNLAIVGYVILRA